MTMSAGGRDQTTKIMVAPNCWTKIAHNLFVFHEGNSNSWIEHAGNSFNFGHVGRWAIHRGPVGSLPKSWDQVTEKRTVRPSDIRA